MIQDGFILVDKPEGWTSFKTDRFVGRLLGTRKVGHLGTLDPFATGLLPVFAGKGLKFLRFCEGFDKGYSCRCVFGAATDTMDKTGEIISENYPSADVLEELEKTDYALIRSAALKVKETKEQLPPAYSAKKIDGVKAYELARKGEMPDLKPSPVTIYSLDITDIMKRDKGLAIDFDCMCSKGTYIRSLCRDMASLMGTCGYVSFLHRAYASGSSSEECVSLEFLPEIKLDPKQTKDIKFGRKIAFPIDVKPEGGERIYYRATNEDKLIAVVFPQEENGDLVMRIERLYAHD